MAPASWLIWGLSLGLLAALLLRDLWQKGQRLTESDGYKSSGLSNRTSLLILLAVFGLITLVILLTATLKTPEAMGSRASPIPWLTVGLLYLAMLAGIAAQYFFFASDETVFRWQVFIKPFLASPVLFIPLASSYQEALHPFESFSMADLMMLLAAFQNGFFWKIVFDRIAGEQEEAKS